VNNVESAGSFELRVDTDNVAWLTFDQPDSKVNLLDTDVMEELDGLLGELESRIATGKIVAVVLESGKDDNFVAGADVQEIAGVRDAREATEAAREGQRIFRRLERLNVPTVAAVHGTCLGGGTEMILACSYRIASGSSDTTIGLPEVKLGILPGFGGTVRLPRLCGIRNAMSIILQGRSVSPSRARRMGLVDRVADGDDFDRRVGEFVSDVLAGKVDAGGRDKSFLEGLLEDTGPGRSLLFWFARRRTRKETGGHYPAPMRAIDVIEETYEMSMDPALEVEARALGELLVTPESRNLTRVFLLTRRARRALPEEVMEGRREVEKLAVVGAGVMGGGIAELAASKDVPVVLKDVAQEPLDDGLRHARELLDRAASKGVFTEDEAGLKFALVEGTLSYDEFNDVDLVVEAVVEKMAVKRQVLREVEEAVPEHAIFATNTSSLSVTELARASSRPERVVGLHFFNPVHKMPLVEVVRGEASGDEALATGLGFALDMGKNPVVVKDGPGFLVNRVLAPYLNEAGYLLEEGAGVRSVDQAISSFGMPMGPCRLLDEVGLDVARHVGREMEAAFGERMKPAGVVDELLEDGRLGKKSGLGFYVYDDGEEKKVDPDLRRMLPRPEETPPDAPEIRRRCLYLMVNEAAHALEDEVVAEAGEVDLAMVMGTGFPPFRGGVLRWADTEGLDTILEGLEKLEGRHGPRFRPAPLLEVMVERGRTFTDPEFA
jgi:3-hydroxyacyl-CoA dehydrogenase/enoyl-CoA hydratase/3-hydroxybutyryl-CoA epimerase